MRKNVSSNEIADYSKWIKRMGKDERLMATHMSLFTALFIHFQRNGFAKSLSGNQGRSDGLLADCLGGNLPQVHQRIEREQAEAGRSPALLALR
jgi:hypothetical protein